MTPINVKKKFNSWVQGPRTESNKISWHLRRELTEALCLLTLISDLFTNDYITKKKIKL